MKKPIIILVLLTIIVGAGYLSDLVFGQVVRPSGRFYFWQLWDTPDTYVSQAGKGIRVNSEPDGLEFYTLSLGNFDNQTAWRIFYSNTDGDVTELALGANGTFLESNGATSAPAFRTLVAADITELVTLTDNSIADTLHRHTELVASDGSPDPALSVDSVGRVGIGTSSPDGTVEIVSGNTIIRIKDTGDTATATTSYVEFGGTTTGAWDRTGYVGDSVSGDTHIRIRAEDSDLILGDSSGVSVLTLSGGDVTATGAFEGATLTKGGNAVPNDTDHLGFFGGTTSAELAGEISDETGSGKATFATAPVFVTSIQLTGADADPAAVAGTIVYDNTIAVMSGGGIRWYDDNSVRLIVDLETDPVDGDDDKLVAYDSAADGFYMSAAGAGDITSVWDDAAGAVTQPVIGTGEFLDGGTATVDAAGEGILLPRGADVSAATAEGQISWDSDNDLLYVGDGAAVVSIAGSFDSTAVDATTWSDNANASNIWTFDVSGTDHTQTAGNGVMTFSHGVTASGTIEGATLTEGGVAVHNNDQMDASSELATIIDDETGTGLIVFNNQPSFADGIKTYRLQDTAAFGPFMLLGRKRDGDPTDDVSSGDYTGSVTFQGYHTGGYHESALIRAIVDATPGNGDMPGRLEFLTSADGSASPTLRVAIDSAGNTKMGDGAWTNYTNVSINGTITPVGTADLELPQASPAVPDADGEVELDFTDGKMVIQHGSAHAELGASTDVVMGSFIDSWSATIYEPDGVNDVLTVKAINSIEFPHGVVITAIYLQISEDSNYTLTFQNFDDFDTINAGDGTIDTVTYTADTTGEIIDSTPTYATIAAGQIIMISIPSTDVDWIHFEIYYYEPAA